MPFVEQDDLGISERAPEPDRLGRATGDPRDLLPCLSTVAEPSIPRTVRVSLLAREPAIIPACVEPVTEQTTTVSKNSPSSASWAATSSAQRAKPWPPSG